MDIEKNFETAVLSYLNENFSEEINNKVVKANRTRTQKKIKKQTKLVKEAQRTLKKQYKNKKTPQFLIDITVKGLKDRIKDLNILKDKQDRNNALINNEIVLNTNNTNVHIPIEELVNNEYNYQSFVKHYTKQTEKQIKELFARKKQTSGTTNQILGLLLLATKVNPELMNNKRFVEYMSRIKKRTKNTNKKTTDLLNRLNNDTHYASLFEYAGQGSIDVTIM